jgi:hypothetical protein
MMQEQLTQALAVADVINSQSVNNASVSSLGIDMSKYHRALFLIQCGSLGAAGTVDGRLQSSAQANFNVAHNITNTNLTQITANNALATIEIRADQVQAGDQYVRLNLTGGGNAVTVGALGLGGEANHKPASAANLNNTYLSQQVITS